MIQKIEEKIRLNHSNDDKQLEVIFSPEKRIIIEAPAGYGKTKTMISKIAYLIAVNKLDNPKKILALTFSVNAAYKIKKDISESLPELFNHEKSSPLTFKNKILSTNYHGLCRKILKKYGYLLQDNLRNIDYILGVDDSKVNELIKMRIGLKKEEMTELINYNRKVKEMNSQYLQIRFNSYLEIVKEKFLPNNFIPFNAIILLVLELFNRFPDVLKFYREYFPIIIVDEFQDTNLLNWELLKKLINEDTQLIFMGDSLQRIYGFIGAIQGIMDKAKKKYDMTRINLEINHRFKDNPKLLTLDQNLRENAKNIHNPNIKSTVVLDVIQAKNQKEEAKKILELTKSLLNEYPDERVILLVRMRGSNTNRILEELNDFNYFYALFNDDDIEYVRFHQKVLIEFLEMLSKSNGRMDKNNCKKLIRNIENSYNKRNSKTITSLIKLLNSFLILIFDEYTFLTKDEKTELIKDTLENRALKQYLEHVDANLIISTVHGAKGLEWDHVIIPDMEKGSFPSFLCDRCIFDMHDCNVNKKIRMSSRFEKQFFDELNVFYVGSTRAKNDVHFSYSKIGKNDRISCFLKLKGIKANFV